MAATCWLAIEMGLARNLLRSSSECRSRLVKVFSGEFKFKLRCVYATIMVIMWTIKVIASSLYCSATRKLAMEREEKGGRTAMLI